MDLGLLRKQFDTELAAARSIEALEQLRVTYLSKRGFVKQAFSSADRGADSVDYLRRLNEFAAHVSSSLSARVKIARDMELASSLEKERIDVTYPSRGLSFGSEHPLRIMIDRVVKVLTALSFDRVDGPEIEDEYHVFDALNTPSDHPARQMHDTFYLVSPGKLLRTHTSSVQIRSMECNKPPFYLFSIGKVYRNDHDSTHSPMFHQVEVLCIDHAINMSHMKYCIMHFLNNLFMGAEVRMRPSYFPFTEPSAEVDIMGKDGKWLEVMGCGMVHPSVLRNVGVSPDEYSGFAFGAGLERLTMLYYDIRDLRHLYSSDLRWGVV